jgi:hypothetical protein
MRKGARHDIKTKISVTEELKNCSEASWALVSQGYIMYMNSYYNLPYLIFLLD